MDDQSTTLYAPTPNFVSGAHDSGASAITLCPSCGKKLLTIGSVLCNWCGAEIEDNAYLQRAAAERSALDAEDRHRIELQRAEALRRGTVSVADGVNIALGVLGGFTGR